MGPRIGNEPRRGIANIKDRDARGSLALEVLRIPGVRCAVGGRDDGVGEGPVNLGELQFNVVFSRYLNPNDSEDSA